MAVSKGIYGLSGSGMDVDTMVKNMMQTQQARYDKMYKKKTKIEWKDAAYNEFYKSLNTFSLTTMSAYRKQSSMSARAAKSEDETIVGVKANGDAGEMTHDISIENLASNAYLQTTDVGITRGTHAESNKSIILKDLLDIEDTDGALLTDVAFSITVKDSSAPDAAGKTLSYTYKQLMGYTPPKGSDEAAVEKVTLNDLAADIQDLGLNITASYDSVNDSFALYNKTGGESNVVSVSVNTDTTRGGAADATITNKLFDRLHLASYDSGTGIFDQANEMDLSSGTAVFAGRAAKAVIDGKIYKSDTNKITAAGVTYTLNKIGNTKATVTSDTDTVVANVKKFVEDYNKMLESMNDKVYEARYNDFDPLTDEEEGDMTEEQVKKWNEKAKSGLLYHDSAMRDIVSEMRTALSTPIDGLNADYNSASKIGLTVSWDYTQHGKIELDEDKLRKALQEDPDAAYKVFGSTSSEYESKGIANRLAGVANDGVKKIKEIAGTTAKADEDTELGEQINDLEVKMKDFEKYMDSYETRLYKQFNAMETAITSLNSQYSFVTSYFNSGS